MRHERPCSDAAPHVTLPSTLSPISGTWPDQNLLDTWPSLHWACFDAQGPWVQAHLYDPSCHAPILVMPWQLLQLTETDAESEGKGDCKLRRLSGMGFRGWVILNRPWTLPWFWKGMGQASQSCGQIFLLILSQCQLHGSSQHVLRQLFPAWHKSWCLPHVYRVVSCSRFHHQPSWGLTLLP